MNMQHHFNDLQIGNILEQQIRAVVVKWFTNIMMLD